MNGEMTVTEQQGTTRHYWLREDFDDLMAVIPNADMPLGDSAASSCSLSYPKHTEGAVAELKLRGLECDGGLLTKLADEGLVSAPLMAGSDRIYQWGKDDIDAAAEWLCEHRRWTSWTHFCWVSNLRYGQVVKAHRVACARHGLGFTLGFDVPGLVVVIEPASDGDQYARARFFSPGTKLEAKEG